MAIVAVRVTRPGQRCRAHGHGDELRATKRDLAARKDNLPWLFVSER
jgi:hypothetical protein